MSGFRDLLANRFVPGDGWAEPVRIDGNATATGQPRVSLDARGRGFVVWMQRCQSTEDYANTRLSGVSPTRACNSTSYSRTLQHPGIPLLTLRSGHDLIIGKFRSWQS